MEAAIKALAWRKTRAMLLPYLIVATHKVYP